MNKSLSGFTLIELMITISIVAVMLTLAAPGISGFFDSKRLINATEQVYSHLQRARSESFARSAIVYVKFNATSTPSTTWQYGISTESACLLDTNACTLVIDDGDGNVDGINGVTDTQDRVLMRFTDSDHQDISMNIANFPGTQITFYPLRGTTNAPATPLKVELTSDGGKRLDVEVNQLGRIKICSPPLTTPPTGYSTGC